MTEEPGPTHVRTSARTAQVDQRVLRRQAIDACRQALFFVELAPVTADVHGVYRQLRRRLPRAYDTGKRALINIEGRFQAPDREEPVADAPRRGSTAREVKLDIERCRQRVATLLAGVLAEELGDATMRAEFAELQKATWEAPIHKLNRELTQFVYRHEPAHVRTARDAWSVLLRNLAFIAVASAFVCLISFVEQIRSLYSERKDFTAGLFALTFAPIAASLARARYRGHPLGVFRRPLVRRPPGFDLRDAAGHGALHVWVHYAIRAVGFLIWLALVSLAVLGFRYGLSQTITWSLCLFAAVATAARVIDTADWLHPAPVRLLLVGWIALWLAVYSWIDFSWWAAALVLAASLLVAGFLWRFRRETLAVALSAVSVLGTVSAIVDEHTEDQEAWRDDRADPPARIARDQWPFPGKDPVIVMIASGGGSRAAILTALALERLERLCVEPGSKPPCETLAQHIHAISAVSGGSLATASYVRRRLPESEPVPHTDVALPAALGDDFLRPVFIGIAHVGLSRGQSLQNYWQDRLKLRVPLGSVAKQWTRALEKARGNSDGHPPFPVPIFNSASLDGHAVVLSPFDWTPYYDVDSESARCFGDGGCMSRNAYDRDAESLGGDAATWVYYRDGVYDLTQLLPHFDPNLAQAVRASANFPFGFPVVQVQTTRRLWYSPLDEDRREAPKERVRLTDGGVLSNSGLWTAYYLLAAHAETLRERGLLLVMVDASRMPEYSGRTRLRDLYAAIGDQAPIAANLHKKMIELLQLRLGGHFAAVEVSLPARSSNNYYTSWALDQSTQAQLRDALEAELKSTNFAQTVTESWSTLLAGKPVRQTLARIPLD